MMGARTGNAEWSCRGVFEKGLQDGAPCILSRGRLTRVSGGGGCFRQGGCTEVLLPTSR